MRKALTNGVETSPASTDANGKAMTLPSFPNPLVLCYGVQWIFFFLSVLKSLEGSWYGGQRNYLANPLVFFKNYAATFDVRL